jgi:hypothetical protein
MAIMPTSIGNGRKEFHGLRTARVQLGACRRGVTCKYLP